MKYGVYLENRPDTWIVEAERDDLEQILMAAYDLGAPVFYGDAKDWEYAIQDNMDECPDMTRDEIIEEMEANGYCLLDIGYIVDLSSFYIEPMAPNVAVGHYVDDNYRFSRYHNLKHNDGLRRVS